MTPRANITVETRTTITLTGNNGREATLTVESEAEAERLVNAMGTAYEMGYNAAENAGQWAYPKASYQQALQDVCGRIQGWGNRDAHDYIVGVLRSLGLKEDA